MSEHIEYTTTGKPHPYHLVNPSIWPLISALSGGFLAVGALLYFHEVEIAGHAVGMQGVYLGLAAVVACMFFWWKDVVHEAVVEKAHSPIAKIGMRYGMTLFIASEVMFFVAFFWAFFDAAFYADQTILFDRVAHTGGHWPPTGIEVVDPLGLPFMMTMILLLSGCSVTWAHHAIVEGRQREFLQALAVTVFLGAFFLCFQVYEYGHATFGFTQGIYSSTFYMATGFHGFHVLIGTIFLFVCLMRARKKHFTAESHFGFEAAAWYWHFVDVVWLFLFIAVYWWGSLGGTIAGH